MGPSIILGTCLLALSALSYGQKQESQLFHRRKDVVLSLVELPNPYKSPKRTSGDLCLPHLDCMIGLPVPKLLAAPVKFASTFQFYTARTGPLGDTVKMGDYLHEQLQDIKSDNIRQDTRLRRTSKRLAEVSKIVDGKRLPFDLSRLESVGFDPRMTTRIICGGYLNDDSTEWPNKMIKLYRKLEPHSNIIKFQWVDGNRGSYPQAAFNSRVAGRQISVMLHYLDQLYGLDPSKVHLIGHSLGAHVAGVVGADSDGKIARISALDPAGAIFFGLQATYRLDPSDAQFVDVHHTNWGSIFNACFGMETPVGHVDYYYNANPVQPGCSNGAAGCVCSHLRAPQYFVELLEKKVKRKSLPIASRLIVDEEEEDEVTEEFEPSVLRDGHSQPGAPLEWTVEGTELKPEFPLGKHGIYVLYTEAKPPFFLTESPRNSFVRV